MDMPNTVEDVVKPSNSMVASPQPISPAPQVTDKILPSLPKAASESLSETLPAVPSMLLAPSANVDAVAEQLTYEAATSLTNPSVPPFLTTTWKHHLNWELPPYIVLEDIFQPVLIDTIQSGYADRSTRCFCAIVFAAAQQHLRTFCTRNIMRGRPADMADCISILDQILTPKGVMVFIRDCERAERLHGRAVLDAQICERTFAEHISEFLEQLPRLGRAAYYGAEVQLRIEAEGERWIHRWKGCVVRTARQAWRMLLSGGKG